MRCCWHDLDQLCYSFLSILAGWGIRLTGQINMARDVPWLCWLCWWILLWMLLEVVIPTESSQFPFLAVELLGSLVGSSIANGLCIHVIRCSIVVGCFFLLLFYFCIKHRRCFPFHVIHLALPWPHHWHKTLSVLAAWSVITS